MHVLEITTVDTLLERRCSQSCCDQAWPTTRRCMATPEATPRVVASSACHLRHTTTSPNQHATVYEISNRDGHYPFALMHKMLGRHQNRDYEQYPAAPEFELTDYYGTPLVTTEEPKGLMASAYPRKLTLTAAEDDPISTLKGAASTAQKRGQQHFGHFVLQLSRTRNTASHLELERQQRTAIRIECAWHRRVEYFAYCPDPPRFRLDQHSAT